MDPLVQRLFSAYAVNNTLRPQSIREVLHGRRDIDLSGVEGFIRSQGDCPFLLFRGTDHADNLCSIGFADLNGCSRTSSHADHNHGFSMTDTPPFYAVNTGDHGIRNDGPFGERDMEWQMEELPGRDSKILPVTSRVVQDPQDPAEVDTLGFSVCSTIETGAAGEEDVRNHRVSRLKSCHIGAYFHHHPCGFVTHDEGECWGISPAIPDVEVGPADTAGSGMDEDVVRADFRGGTSSTLRG